MIDAILSRLVRLMGGDDPATLRIAVLAVLAVLAELDFDEMSAQPGVVLIAPGAVQGPMLRELVQGEGLKAPIWQWYPLLHQLEGEGVISSQEDTRPEVVRARGGRPLFWYRRTGR